MKRKMIAKKIHFKLGMWSSECLPKIKTKQKKIL